MEKKSLTNGYRLEVAGIGWISRVRVDSRELRVKTRASGRLT